MKLLIATLILCSISQTPATRVADVLGGKYISGNKIAGQPPAGYERFLVMWVDDPGICRKDLDVRTRENYLPDTSGRIAVCGRIVFEGKNFPNGGSVADGNYLMYTFKEAYLIDLKEKPVLLEVVTQEVDGVYYRFSGTYAEHPSSTSNVYLFGNMSRFVDGKLVSENTMGFAPFNIIE